MKNFHQNLLIVLALSLCGLCVYQWYDQTLQRNRLENLNHLLADKSTAIQGYTNSLDNLNHEVAQMDARITELKTAATARLINSSAFSCRPLCHGSFCLGFAQNV